MCKKRLADDCTLCSNKHTMPKRNSSHECEISVASGTPIYTQDGVSSVGELETPYSGVGYRWKKRGAWMHRAMLGHRTVLVHGLERRVYVNWRESGVTVRLHTPVKR